MILFLDFGGVLHVRGQAPMEYAEQLIKALALSPPVRIVLSTRWVEAYGLDEVVEMLPEGLQSLVIGATCIDGQASPETRYADIAAYAARMRFEDWLAIDDDADGWPDEERHRLDPRQGLSTPGVIDELIERLHATSKPRSPQP